MRSRTQYLFRTFFILVVLATTLLMGACSHSEAQKDKGALKRTQYCDRYREFDGKVATASTKKQLDLLQRIVTAEGFLQQ